MKGYTYNKKLKDPRYVLNLIRDKVGNVVTITEYPDKVTIWFNRELTNKEKEILDKLIESDPEPVEVYEFFEMTLDDVIEREVGIRPVFTDFSREIRYGKIMFDRKLTPEQRNKLERLLKSLKDNSYIEVHKIK